MKLFPNLAWMRRTTWLCLVLLGLTGAAQALHNHTQEVLRGDADAGKARCTICVAGHAPQQAGVTQDVVPPERQELAWSSASTSGSPQATRGASHIRPPPAL